MKKTIYSMAVLALFAAVSCSKENPSEFEQAPISYNFTFEASMEEALSAKAELASDGKSIDWKIGDTAVLYFPKAGEAGKTVTAKATVTSVDAKGVATFSANVPETADKSEVIASYNNAPGSTETDLHPYYVLGEAAYCRHRIVIPEVQKAVNGSFDPASIPLVGRWTGTAGDPVTMLFKNPVSLLAINLTNNSSKTISSITVSNTAVYISGYFYYMSADRTGFSFKASKSNQKEVTISGDITNGKYYFIIPGESQSLSGLKINFYASDGTVASKTNPNSISIDRNNIYSFGNFTLADADFALSGIPFSDTKVNMDDEFYTKLLKSCTGSESPYTLSINATCNNVTIIPKNNNTCTVNIGDNNFIGSKFICKFTSASSGNAEMILYCALGKKSSSTGNNRVISVTWKDKTGEAKTVPSEVTTTLTNTTTSNKYYHTDENALHLHFPGVAVGDVFEFTATDNSNHRFYKFYWKEAPSK